MEKKRPHLDKNEANLTDFEVHPVGTIERLKIELNNASVKALGLYTENDRLRSENVRLRAALEKIAGICKDHERILKDRIEVPSILDIAQEALEGKSSP